MPSKIQIALFSLLPACLVARPDEYPGKPRQLSEARLAAPPVPTLTSDFKKNNASASWAPGYPKVWAQAEKKFSIPSGTFLIPVIQSAFSPDGKYLLLTNDTDTVVFRVDTGATVTSFTNKYTDAAYMGALSTLISPASGGEFDFFICIERIRPGISHITQQRISADGLPKGPVFDHVGTFIGYSPSLEVNSEGKRVLIAVDYNDTFIYNLEAPEGKPVILTGHFDHVMSASFSPDKKSVASTGWDGHVKLWNSATGKLILDIPPADPTIAPSNQYWTTRFSPDGKKLLYSIGSPLSEIKIVSLENPTDVVTIGPYDGWVRTIEYSSDGSHLALGGTDWLQVLRTSDYAVVQEWRMGYSDTKYVYAILNIHWYDNDTKLKWSYGPNSEMYDFETNLRYRWGPDKDEGIPPPGWLTTAGEWFPFPSLGWFGSHESDSTVRIWPLPA